MADTTSSEVTLLVKPVRGKAQEVTISRHLLEPFALGLRRNPAVAGVSVKRGTRSPRIGSIVRAGR